MLLRKQRLQPATSSRSRLNDAAFGRNQISLPQSIAEIITAYRKLLCGNGLWGGGGRYRYRVRPSPSPSHAMLPAQLFFYRENLLRQRSGEL